MMRCMRMLDAKNISLAQWSSYWGILGFPFAPTIDGEFLPRWNNFSLWKKNTSTFTLFRDPWEMLRDGDFANVEIMIGTNQDEGIHR